MGRAVPAGYRPVLVAFSVGSHLTNFTIGAGEQTLPIWIFSNLFRPPELPIVNAVVVLMILISIIPVYLAHRLGGEAGGAPGKGGGGGVGSEATAVP